MATSAAQTARSGRVGAEGRGGSQVQRNRYTCRWAKALQTPGDRRLQIFSRTGMICVGQPDNGVVKTVDGKDLTVRPGEIFVPLQKFVIVPTQVESVIRQRLGIEQGDLIHTGLVVVDGSSRTKYWFMPGRVDPGRVSLACLREVQEQDPLRQKIAITELVLGTVGGPKWQSGLYFSRATQPILNLWAYICNRFWQTNIGKVISQTGKK